MGKPYELTENDFDPSHQCERFADVSMTNFKDIEKLAQKKLLEWLRKMCVEHEHKIELNHFDCPECMQSLLKDFGI